MKKLIISLLTMLMLVSATMFAVGCVNNKPKVCTNHTGGTATCTAQAVCTNCGKSYGEIKEHKYNNLKHNDSKHWYECVCGEKSGEESHKGGTATETTKAVCEVCNAQYGQILNHTHEYKTLKSNVLSHWYECSCGSKSGEESHRGGTATETNKALCEVCGVEYGSVLGHTHNFNLQQTEDVYIKEQATCTKKAKYYYSCACGVAGTEYFEAGEFGDHNFDQKIMWEKYSANEPTCLEKYKYYYSCLCGEKGEETFETDDYGYHNEVNHLCNVCNKEIATNGLRFTLNREQTGYIVSDYWGYDSDIYIPAIYEALPVLEIGESCFYTRRRGVAEIEPGTHIYSVTFGPNCQLKRIGDGAFYDCKNLKNIEIPKTVISIGNSAFLGCSSLESINLPNVLTEIGVSAFQGCSSWLFESITIPASVNCIGSSAFANCNSLRGIKFEENIKLSSIEQGTFENCRALENITIPASVEKIGARAFMNCRNLSSLTIAENSKLISVGASAFKGCNYLYTRGHMTIHIEANNNPYYILQGVDYEAIENHPEMAEELFIEIESDTKFIADYALSFLEAKYIYLDSTNLVSIGGGAFTGCSLVEEIYIPESVKYIGDYAFDYCSSLQHINIPDSVQYIGRDIVSGCYNLQYNVKNGLKYLGNSNNNYLYLADVEDYEMTSMIIEDSCKFISHIYFDDLSLLQYNVKDGLKYVGTTQNPYMYLIGVQDASITSATIDSNCKFIGENAFYNCEQLQSVIIPDGVTSIGYSAFANCFMIEKIIIPNSVLCVEFGAFEGVGTDFGQYIYCEAQSKPFGWDSSWASDGYAQIVWGYTEN